MPACDRPHWLDVISDLLTHITVADAHHTAEGTVLARILSITVMDILAAQSDAALADALDAIRRDHEPDVAEALSLEHQRRNLPTPAEPARARGVAS